MNTKTLSVAMIMVIIICLFSFALLGWYCYYEAQRRLDIAVKEFEYLMQTLEQYYQPKEVIPIPLIDEMTPKRGPQ